MKKLYFSLTALALATLLGCGGPSGTGSTAKHAGGPGVSNASEKGSAMIGAAADKFELDPPNLSTHIKQGETKAVTIGIKRGKNFDEDVTLKLADLPKGVTVDPASPAIKHGDKEAKFTLKAADDASLGDHTINLTGHPSKGEDAANTFKITIEKK